MTKLVPYQKRRYPQQLAGDDDFGREEDDGVNGDMYWDAGFYQGPLEDVIGLGQDARGNDVFYYRPKPQRSEPILSVGKDERGNDVIVTFDPYELSLAQLSSDQLLQMIGDELGIDEFGSLFGSIAHAVSSVAKAVAKPVASVAKTAVKVATTVATAPLKGVAAVTKSIPVVGAITKTVSNVANAPVKAAAKLTTGVISGQNIAQAALQAGKALGTSALQAGALVGNVSSFIPGLGTGVAFAIQYTASVGDAIAHGKNVLSSAKEGALKAALNSLPGGTVTGALITTVANIVAKGASGQNLIKSATHELAAGAISLVPTPQAQALLQGAADAALKGQNVLTGVQAGAINAALATIPDANARAVLDATLHGKPLTDVVKSAGPALLARAAGMAPTGGVAALVTGITKKTPDQIAAAANTLAQTLAKSPLVHPLPNGQTAMVIPQTGVPALAALSVMTGIAAAVHSPVAEQSNAAKQVVLATKTLADTGHAGAQLALDAIEQASLAAKGKGAIAAASEPHPIPVTLQERAAALPVLATGARRMLLAILPDATIVGQGSAAMQHLPPTARMLALDIATDGHIHAHV
jgi:hypothetical protein